jgi:hypothetical protein
MASSHEQHEAKILAALYGIHRFGWLRSAELGPLIYSHPTSARQRADALIRAMLKRKLIIARNIPGAGRAFVLSSAGVRWLAEAGIDARSGKDWGETSDTWRPPFTWQHDLMATGVLVHLASKGNKVIPEHTLKSCTGTGKRPDGVIVDSQGVGYWLEVERAKKDGKYQEELVRALVAVATTGIQIAGVNTTIPVIAYNPEALDGRGFVIDHPGRIRGAISRIAKQEVAVVWCACQMLGAGVSGVSVTRETIVPDRAHQIRAVLDRWGWRPTDNEEFASIYLGHKVMIWEDPVGITFQGTKAWVYLIDDDDAMHGFGDSEEEVKQFAVQELVKRGW